MRACVRVFCERKEARFLGGWEEKKGGTTNYSVGEGKAELGHLVQQETQQTKTALFVSARAADDGRGRERDRHGGRRHQ